ncbi:hypothetical protein Cni_G08068 [Canna indica]|uniref:DUF7356 domain-containing protein n=1 Tax=Canna indica TaxID=4628 RepID=A0AAQ3K3E3_9LILI|nr:hypothetical protein Cni_G08068 [Canna indica]
MKRNRILVFAVLSLILGGDGRHLCAVEVNANVAVTNIPAANSDANKTTSPLLNNVGKEKKSDDLSKGSQEETENYHGKGSLNDSTTEERESNNSIVTETQNLSDVINSTVQTLEDSLVEGCDPSSRCINEKDKFIACLRVPGQDSLDLSLLIQNRGTRVLDVNILAPDFVRLEETSVKLEPNLNKEVKVFVKNDASDASITLKAEDGNCSLNLRNMISTSVRSETSRMARYLSLPKHNFSINIFLAAVFLVGVAGLCIRFWRSRSVSKYEKVDMVLPVSAGGIKETDEADGWDNSWGDGWDDEAPKTPPKPVSTPSFKGLASRKLNKDGWKD